MPPSPREAPITVQVRSVPSRVAPHGAQPAGPRSSDDAPRPRPSRSSRRRGRASPCRPARGRSSTSWRRARACPCSGRRAGPELVRPPAQARARASRRTAAPAASESSRWRTPTRVDRAQRAAQRRRVEGGRDALAPRRRAQPGEVDDVGRRRSGRSARAKAAAGVGLVLGVDQDDVGQPPQRVDALLVAVRRPHHRGEVGDDAAGRRSCRAGPGAAGRCRSRPARARPRSAPGARASSAAPIAHRVERAPARLDGARRSAATGGSGRPARAGSRPRRGTRGRRSPRGSSPARGRTRAPPGSCGASSSRSAASIALGVVSRALQTSSLIGTRTHQSFRHSRPAPSSASASAGPAEPAS